MYCFTEYGVLQRWVEDTYGQTTVKIWPFLYESEHKITYQCGKSRNCIYISCLRGGCDGDEGRTNTGKHLTMWAVTIGVLIVSESELQRYYITVWQVCLCTWLSRKRQTPYRTEDGAMGRTGGSEQFLRCSLLVFSVSVSQRKKATIHQVTPCYSPLKISYFQVITTSADDSSL